MTPVDASTIVGDAITALSSDAAVIIPAALGVSVLIFGASFLWRKARKLVS